jgi:hypothetical protein
MEAWDTPILFAMYVIEEVTGLKLSVFWLTFRGNATLVLAFEP